MIPRCGQLDVDALMRERRWMVHVARELVGDQRAEDVVQDTCLAAVDQPPREPRALRSWLNRVLRNRATTLLRRERRLLSRERAAAKAIARDPGPDPIERFETQRRVSTAILELADPYREALIRRYYDGQSPAEIAKSMGAPASTVRTWLSRALEQLRARLDGEYGSRMQWLSVLIPQFVRGQRIGILTASLTVGGLLVTHKSTVALIAIAAILLGICVGRTPTPSVAKPSTSSNSTSHDVLDGVTKRVADAVPELAPRATVDSDSATTSIAEPASREAIVRGRIRRSDGESLENARVQLWREAGASSVGADGYFEIHSPLDRATWLLLDDHGVQLAIENVRPKFSAPTELDLIVDVDRSCALRLVDALTARPIADADVSIYKEKYKGQGSFTFGTSDRDGRLLIPYLPCSDYRVLVTHPDYTPWLERVKLTGDVDRTISVPRARLLTITLRAFEDYAGVEELSWHAVAPRADDPNYLENHSGSGPVDARGRFVINAPRPGTWRFTLSGGEGFPSVSEAITIPQGDGPVRASMDLPRVGELEVHGRIATASGEAVRGATFVLGPNQAPIDDDGRYVIDNAKAGRVAPILRVGRNVDRVDYYLPSVQVGDRRELDADFELPGDQRLEIELRGLPASLANGIAAFALHNTAGGPQIFGYRPAYRPLACDYLEAGRYRLSVSIDDTPIAYQVIELAVGPATTVHTIDFRAPAEVELELPGVADGAYVQLLSPPLPDLDAGEPATFADRLATWRAERFAARATVSAEHAHILLPVVDAEWSISVQDYRVHSCTIELRSGVVTPIRVELQPSPPSAK